MGGKSSTSTVTNTPPPEVMQAYKDLLAKANPVADKPYQPYTGGVNGSGFEQNQLTGFQNIADLSGASNGAFGSASSALGAAGTPTYSSVSQYMSPYLQDVVNSTMANMQEQNAQQQQGVIGNAIAKGAMGGNRVGVAQAELARQQNLANQSTIANLYNSGYNTALSAAQADKAANLQAASEYSNLGQTAMQTNLAQAAAQVGAGTQQQQFNYQQYQNQLSYPFQSLGWLANIVEGIGSGMGGTQTSTQPSGNTGSSILGGLLGLGSLFLNRGGVVHEDRPARAQGGVIPYTGSSGIIPLNDNGRPSANDNSGYVPEAATGTMGRSTMPSGVVQPAQNQGNQMLQQGISSMTGALKEKYPNGVLSTVDLPTTAPIPTPNPLTGEAGLPAKIGDVSADSGILSTLGSLFGFADGGVARKGYDVGGLVDPLIEGVKDLLGSEQAPQALSDTDFNARTGVVPAPSINDRPMIATPVSPDTGVVPASGGGLAPLPSRNVADLPVKTVAQAPSDYFGQGVDVSRLPAGMRNNNPGNIKFVGQNTPGIIGPSQNLDQGDPQAVFDSPYSGMRAAAQLALKKNVNGASTVDRLIAGNGGWTPGNHQAAANIANTMGIAPDSPIDLAQPSQMKNFLRGLITQEHGQAGALYSDDLISSAVNGITVPTAGVAYNGAQTGNGGSSALSALFGDGNNASAPSSSANTAGVVAQDDPRGILSSILHGERPQISNDMRMALLSAGLGMMSGTSPNFATNVGTGGMQGIKAYMEKQQLNRENAQAQSEIATRAGQLGLEGKRVDIAGQQLALEAKKNAADIAQTTAETAKTNLETQAGRYQRAIGPNGIMVTDVTKPYDTPRLITWSDLQNGAQLPGDGSSVLPSDQGGGAPVKAAPIAPAGPMPAAAAVDHSNPSEGFITDPPKNIPVNGMLFNPMGQKIAEDQSIKGLEQARNDYQAGQAMKVQLDMMKDAAHSLPDTGFLSRGAGATARASIAKNLNSALQTAGIQPYFDANSVGSYEELNKLATRFGFDLARTLGSREAASIVDQAQSAVPSGENTKQGFERIVAGIEAMTQRQSDYYTAMQKWQQQTGGDITGFDKWFNTTNPPEKYARSAVLSTAAVPKTQAEIDNAAPGTVFNIDGKLMVK